MPLIQNGLRLSCSTFKIEKFNFTFRLSNFCPYRFKDTPPLELPSDVVASILELFFPDGRDSILNVGPTSTFQYAQELRELLPRESEKEFLMFDEVADAFLRLMNSYIQRTASLQSFGNMLFRQHLFLWFGIKVLPSWLIKICNADVSSLTALPNTAEKLTTSEDDVPSPGEGLLLRTTSTTADTFSQSPLTSILRWDDETTQLVHFLLHRLFHPDQSAELRKGQRVCIHGMSSGFLNGAEGYYEGQSASQPGRVEVRLVLPSAVVQKVQADNNTTTVLIPEGKILRYPDANDVTSSRRLQLAAAAGCSVAVEWLAKFAPFMTMMSFSLQRGPESDITMADFIKRFRMASSNVCLNPTSDFFFLDPVEAYATAPFLQCIFVTFCQVLAPQAEARSQEAVPCPPTHGLCYRLQCRQNLCRRRILHVADQRALRLFQAAEIRQVYQW
jgi:hypothetical protein